MKRFLCIIGLLAVAPVRAEEPATSLRNITRAPMIEGLEALRERDYPKAQSAFQAAQALLDQQPLKADSYEDRATRAAIAYVTAKAVGEGKLGDPCPILITARAHVDSAAKLATQTPTIDHMREIGREADADIRASSVKFGCTKADPAEKGSIPAKLAGHYYLSGVMETGSELLLKPDGVYDYFISYGAVDQFSKGTWRRVGDEVVLTPETPAAGAPLFKLDSLEPWDVDAEDYVQTARHEARLKATIKLCPFLGEPDINENTVPPPVAPASSPTSGAEPRKVDHALVYGRAALTEAQLRRTYERAAQAAMMPGNHNVSRHDTARLQRYLWQSSRDDLLSARRRADADDAVPPDPVLPPMCVVPDAPDARDIADKEWMRGFAVKVADPVQGLSYANVDVIFHLADGKDVTEKTQRRGVAWIAKPTSNPVTALSLSYRGNGREKAPFERFTLSNIVEGVQRIVIDSRQLMPPAFDEMRLVVEGNALSGPGGRGRYTKRD
jgi:hypothetical protein